MPRPRAQPLRDLCAALRVLFEGREQSVTWRLAMTTLLAVCGGALAGVAPLAFKGMIDAAATASKPGQPLSSLGMFALAYLLCLCIGRLISEARPLLLSAAEQRLYERLRRRYLEHLLNLPLEHHLNRRTGAQVHGLQQAISGYQVMVFSLINSVAPVLVETLTVLIVLHSLGQPALTAIFAAAAITYLLVLTLRTNDLSNAAQAVSMASVNAYSTLADGLINYEPIKCFGAEQRTLDGFRSHTKHLERCWSRLQHRRLAQGLATTAVFTMAMAACIAITTKHVLDGTLSIGGFVLANLYMVQLVRPLEMLSSAVRDVAQSLAFIRPLIDVFETPAEPAVAASGKAPLGLDSGPDAQNRQPTPHSIWRQAPRVSFRSVQLAFDGAEPVLNNFNLEVPAGCSVAIVGATGCGKSSLVRLLLRLCQPKAGCILLDDVDIGTLPLAALRSMIAVVPQDVMLLNTTIADNIGMGRSGATRPDIEHAARLAGLHDFICTLPRGYDTAIGERGLKLSGGERQRIAIARAILRDPLVYVFDEATSMLDATTERAIMRNLAAISEGRTTISIAHRLSAIQGADAIAVLAGGKIVEQGTHASLLSFGGAYAAMWRAQQSSAAA